MNLVATTIVAVIAIFSGVLTATKLSSIAAIHEFGGRMFHRGRLIAKVNHRGIFEADLRALLARKNNLTGQESDSIDSRETASWCDDLIAQEALQSECRHADAVLTDGRIAAVRAQFADDRQFRFVLGRSGVSLRSLRRMVAQSICGAASIESEIAVRLKVSTYDAEQYFQAHQCEFVQPQRVRIRHIFFAAPEDSAPEVTEAKRSAIEDVASRLNRGEEFSDLAAAVSEDEASKMRGGDLGFFAADRVPPEFWSIVANLAVNAPIQVVQSHLGFHAVQILESRPMRTMTFDEALPEIRSRLLAQKRRNAVGAIQGQLARTGVLMAK